MARKYEDGKLDRLYEAVEDFEGEWPGFFARLLGWQRSDVRRALPALEEKGLLVRMNGQPVAFPAESALNRH